MRSPKPKMILLAVLKSASIRRMARSLLSRLFPNSFSNITERPRDQRGRDTPRRSAIDDLRAWKWEIVSEGSCHILAKVKSRLRRRSLFFCTSPSILPSFLGNDAVHWILWYNGADTCYLLQQFFRRLMEVRRNDISTRQDSCRCRCDSVITEFPPKSSRLYDARTVHIKPDSHLPRLSRWSKQIYKEIEVWSDRRWRLKPLEIKSVWENTDSHIKSNTNIALSLASNICFAICFNVLHLLPICFARSYADQDRNIPREQRTTIW